MSARQPQGQRATQGLGTRLRVRSERARSRTDGPASADKRELRLVQHSPAVVEIFEMLDLGAFFGDALLIH